MLQTALDLHEACCLELVERSFDAGVLRSARDPCNLSSGHAGIGPGEDAERVGLCGSQQRGEWLHELHVESSARSVPLNGTSGALLCTLDWDRDAVREHVSSTVGCIEG